MVEDPMKAEATFDLALESATASASDFDEIVVTTAVDVDGLSDGATGAMLGGRAQPRGGSEPHERAEVGSQNLGELA